MAVTTSPSPSFSDSSNKEILSFNLMKPLNSNGSPKNIDRTTSLAENTDSTWEIIKISKWISIKLNMTSFNVVIITFKVNESSLLVISHCLVGWLGLILLLVLLLLLNDDTEWLSFICDPDATDPWGMFSLTCFESWAVSVRDAPNISLKLSWLQNNKM